jgi:hypothetical protein
MFSVLRKWVGLSQSNSHPDTTLPDTIPIEWFQDLVGPIDWNRFYDSELLRGWADEMTKASKAESYEDWLLKGANLLLIGDEVESLSEMVKMAASQAGFRYLKVPASSVPELVESPRQLFKSIAPAFVQLDAGEWSSILDEKGLMESRPNGWRTVWQTIDIVHPVVFILCIKNGSLINPEWRKYGAFDRCIHIQTPNAAFLGQRFLTLLKSASVDNSLQANHLKIGLMLESEFPTLDEQRLAALQMKRLGASQGRPLKFDDLANLAIRGAEEFSAMAKKPSSEAKRKKTAYHEAGHACISVIESQGRNIPDYCSIVPARDFAGIVMESLSYLDGLEEFTFENLLLRTRIALAGRAAEEIYFGPIGISSGANSDLSNATRISFHMFAHSGFHPQMDLGQSTSSNLAVIGRDEIDQLQNDRIQREVRLFLSTQYEYVLDVLKKHRNFVDAVADRLLWDPVIDQLELTEIASQFSFISSAVDGKLLP